MHFNLSHSEGLALFAVSLNQEVGVDIESVKWGTEMRNLAGIALTAAEAKLLSRLPQDSIPSTFIACWTAKEAYLKARGKGLRDLQEVELTLTASGVPQFLADRSAPRAVDEWGLVPLPMIPGHEACLAVRARTRRLACWRLEVVPRAAVLSGAPAAHPSGDV